MAELDAKEQSGISFISDIMGATFGSAFSEAAQANRFGSAITRMAARWAFHDTWQHTGIGLKEKSIATISALIASRQNLELKNHVKIGMANGLSPVELEGLLIQLTPYLGFPAIASAMTVVIEAMREAGISPDDIKTPEERGLL